MIEAIVNLCIHIIVICIFALSFIIIKAYFGGGDNDNRTGNTDNSTRK